jgi:hypothetical protein
MSKSTISRRAILAGVAAAPTLGIPAALANPPLAMRFSR